MKTIPLTQGKFALVDDEDFEELNKHKWYTRETFNIWYAVRAIWQGVNKNVKSISMHRFIMKTPKNMQTDHIDGNGLNNQRNNLRICNNMENGCNRKINKNNTSGFKGVSYKKSRETYEARIMYQKKSFYLGNYIKAKDAALAYDKAAKKLHKQFAKINYEIKNR